MKYSMNNYQALAIGLSSGFITGIITSTIIFMLFPRFYKTNLWITIKKEHKLKCIELFSMFNNFYINEFENSDKIIINFTLYKIIEQDHNGYKNNILNTLKKNEINPINHGLY